MHKQNISPIVWGLDAPVQSMHLPKLAVGRLPSMFVTEAANEPGVEEKKAGKSPTTDTKFV
jgi:hypothetical protein